MTACPHCQSNDTATLPMIHQAGLSVTAKRGIFGQHAGSAVTITALAATAIPPMPRRKAVTTAGTIFVIVGAICCFAGALVFGGAICAAGLAGVISGKRAERSEHAQELSAWESTWCCRSCGKRWKN